jgi:hypothetical protein
MTIFDIRVHKKKNHTKNYDKMYTCVSFFFSPQVENKPHYRDKNMSLFLSEVGLRSYIALLVFGFHSVQKCMRQPDFFYMVKITAS